EDGFVRTWDTKTGQPTGEVRRIPLSLPGIALRRTFALALGRDAHTVVLGNSGHTARFWAPERPGPQTLYHDGEDVWAVAVSPDGTRILTGASDGLGRVFDAADGRLLSRLPHGEPVSAVAFHPSGRTLLTGGWDSRIRRWNARDGSSIGGPLIHDPAGA